MKFDFKDILTEDLYKCKVVFVFGPYNIFNNLVIDKIRNMCKPEDSIITDSELLKEFGLDIDTSNSQEANKLNFDSFITTVNIPSVNGKWYCNENLVTLKKNQIEQLLEYCKHPNDNGRLVIYSTEYKDYFKLLRNNILKNSKECGVIQLSFPNKETLKKIVTKEFNRQGAKISEQALDYFIMRMSIDYENYFIKIRKVVESVEGELEERLYEENQEEYREDIGGCEIDLDIVQRELKDVSNYIVDDFIIQMLEPMKSDQISVARKIYKIYKSLLRDMGAQRLIYQIRYRIDVYIEFRKLINTGIIPIKVRYSVKEVQNKIDKDSKLKNMTDFRFRRLAFIASKTSLKDWLYMKWLINTIDVRDKDEVYEKVLYELVHRSVFNSKRLQTDLMLEPIDDIGYNLDKYRYKDRRG